MTSSYATYDSLAEAILRDYLRSAIIIDDQWPEHGPAAEPVLNSNSSFDENEAVDNENPWKPGPDDNGFDVNPPTGMDIGAKDAELLADLQRNLVEAGLIACGFRFSVQKKEVAIRLARRADIIVLDWHLARDDGSEALDILKGLKGTGLRFICIFTGHGRVREVGKSLEETLGPRTVLSGSGDGDLRIENLVIAIRNKKGIGDETPGLTTGAADFISSSLAGLVRNYDGLVQLAMLELTQQHLRHLPKILDRIEKTIDPAVFLEARDEASPVGPDGSFLSVLVDEWRAHLEMNSQELLVLGKEGRKLFGSRIATRLDDLGVPALREKLEGCKYKKAPELAKQLDGPWRSELKKWLQSGCEKKIPAPRGYEFGDKEVEVSWSFLLASSVELGTSHPVEPLLQLDALFHQQFESPKLLVQGTLVHLSAPALNQSASADDGYYLCITPACDTARPEKVDNMFTFLRARKIENDEILSGGRRDTYFVVRRDGRLICLEAKLKSRLVLCIISNRFDTDNLVYGGLVPLPNSGPQFKLRRVAQLRTDHCLAIAAAAAADSSRVGVNRVEFIRKKLAP